MYVYVCNAWHYIVYICTYTYAYTYVCGVYVVLAVCVQMGVHTCAYPQTLLYTYRTSSLHTHTHTHTHTRTHTGLRPTIFIAPRSRLSNFGAVLLAIMTLMIALAVIVALFFLTLIIMACKKRRHRNGGDSQNTRRPSFWSRARSSVRSRASSYSFVWTRQGQDPNSLPPTDSTSTTGILQGSYLKWTDSDINAESKSSTLKSAASVDLTTFNSPLDPQPV